MKAAFVVDTNVVRIEDRPIPQAGRGEIVVRMKACGVCGTDVHKVQGQSITSRVLGHEVVGEVAQVGEGVVGFQVGERVFVHHHVPCYECYYCKRGDYTLCESFASTNIEPCGFAEYFKVPRPNVERGAVLKLPQNVAYEEATFIEPTACCLRGLSKSHFRPGDECIVLGCGPIGLTQVRLLSMLGAGRVLASDLVERRLEAARKFGASATLNPQKEDLVERVREETQGTGCDIAIVTVASPRVMVQAFDLVRKGGVVLLFGGAEKGATLSYDVSNTFLNEVSMVSSYSTSEVETNQVLDLMATGRLNLSTMVTHRFKLQETDKAIKCAAEAKDSLKVIVLSD